jgi:hypothetical protein
MLARRLHWLLGVVEERAVDTDGGHGHSLRAGSPGCGAILPVLLREPGVACEADLSPVGDLRIA